ncbi:MAG: hypothetical protein J6Z45_05845 [Oscillospiraceae bacterium]|nr:hypothetical protein [Oscillospiraceae bacterium]
MFHTLSRSLRRLLHGGAVIAAAAALLPALPALKAEAASYDLTIDGVQVTDSNKNDILGNGIFSYSSYSRTLSINGSYNATSSYAISSDISNLTIDVKKESVLTSKNLYAVLYIRGDTTITGGRKLTLKQKGNPSSSSQRGTNAVACYNSASLTIKQVDLTVQSLYGDGMMAGAYNTVTDSYDQDYTSKLKVIESDVVVEPGENLDIGIHGFHGGIELKGCSITTPSDYLIKNGAVYTRQGEYEPTYSKKVVITADSYDLMIKGKKVKGSNCGDILGDGVFRYVNSTKNLFIEGDSYFNDYTGIESHIPGLKILVMKDSRMTFRLTGRSLAPIELYADTSIMGTGTLTVNTESVGIRMNAGTLTISGTKVIVNSTIFGIHGNNDRSSKLVIREAYVASSGNTSGLEGFLGGITLDQSFISEPENGVIRNGAIRVGSTSACSQNVVIEPVKKLDPALFSLSKSKYEYTGRPVKVGSYLRWQNHDGIRPKYGEDFTLEYENNIACGADTAQVKIVGTGRFKGTVTLKYTIMPKKQAKPKLRTLNGHIRVEWTADENAEGYQVQYCKDPGFTGSTLHSASITDRAYCTLATYPRIDETWYVRVRAYVKNSAGSRYGTWSDASSITVGTIDNVTLSQTSFVYEGRPVKVGNYISVKSGTTSLRYNIDFILVYKNNTAPGTATVRVEGIGEYADSVVSKRYTITAP